jgi:hypothetical protein
MYRRPKFLEILLDIRRDMAHEVDYDTDLFAEVVRHGRHAIEPRSYSLNYDEESKTSNGRRKRSKSTEE